MKTSPQPHAPHAAFARPDTAKKMLAQGMEFHRTGRLEEASRAYDAVLRADPGNGDALHLLGLVMASEGQLERGIELIQQAVAVQPHFAAAFFNLGNLLTKQEKLQDAVVAYQRAIALQRKFPEAQCNLGSVLHALGKYDEAVTALRRAISDQKNFADAHRNLGLVYQKQGRLDEAAVALRRAAALKPQDANVQCELGVVLQAQGKFPEAIDAFDCSVALNPNNALIWLNLGACLQTEERLDDAEAAYRQVVTLKYDFVEKLRLLKDQIESNVWNVEAWHMQRDILVLESECARALDYLGSSLLLQGKITEAIATWRQTTPLLSLPRQNNPPAPAATISKRLHTTKFETARFRFSLDFNVILLTGDCTVSVCAPALSLIRTGASDAEALQQLDRDILKKAEGPMAAVARDGRPALVSFGHSSDPAKHEIRETIEESPAYLPLFAQQLFSINHNRGALECMREARHLGQQSKPSLVFHAMLAAICGCFDEAIALYLEGVMAFADEGGGPITWSGERSPNIAVLLEEASTLFGTRVLPAPAGNPFNAADALPPFAEGGDTEATTPSPPLQIEACNMLAEDLINSENNFGAAREVYIRRSQFQQEWLRASGVGSVDTLFLGFDWVRNVGHIAFLGLLIKMRELGLSPWQRIVVLACESSVANLAYLNQWRRYLTVVTDLEQVVRLNPLTIACGFRFSTLFPFPNRTPLYNSELAAAVEEKWEAAGRAPLLALGPEQKADGWRSLAAFGIKTGDWFVGLHVREPGFHKVNTEHRDAPIDSYLRAIETITRRGGWVIRMGDPTMSPLPAMEHVIDYPNTALKSAAMDVFLCAECRFFIGVHSGLSYLPNSFGRPSVMTNWLNTGSLPPFSRNGLFLPKLIRLKAGQRLVSFRDTLGELWGARCYGTYKLDAYGVELVNNTAEEIDEIVREMLDRLDGISQPSEEENLLARKFVEILPTHSKHATSRIGSAFLKRHQELL